MSKKLHQVSLTDQERQELSEYVHKGVHPSRVLNRVRVLLLSDAGKTDEQITEAVGVSLTTVFNLRRRFCAEGLYAALYEKPRPGQAPKITPRIEAQLCSIACSDPPEGRNRWTLRLLADRLVELELVDTLSHTAVADALKKMTLSRG